MDHWTYETITQLIQKRIDAKITDFFGYNVLHCYFQGLHFRSQGFILTTVFRFLLNCGCEISDAQTNDEIPLSPLCRNVNGEDLIEGIR